MKWSEPRPGLKKEEDSRELGDGPQIPNSLRYGGFLDLSRLHALRTNTDAADGPIDYRSYTLQIRIPATFGHIMSM